MGFENFSLETSLLDGLLSMGYEKPTPVQEEAIPPILEGKDIIACAQTGTGKTAAYLLPVINDIIKGTDEESIHCIIIAPTRELAVQIDQQVQGFSYFTPVSSIAVYGGGESSTWDKQKKALTHGADIIIATPGRLIAHLNMGYVKVGSVKQLILDEADRMLDMGFMEDIMQIISHLPKKRQNLLFSATMPSKIRSLAKKILNEPTEVSIAVSKTADGIIQGAYMTYDAQKIPLISALLKGKEKKLPSILIFCSTKRSVKELEIALQKEGFSAKSIHSDLEQKDREIRLNDFRNRKIQVLIATDILSRGIDIENISLVINFDVPGDAEDYVHRVGRTARAESTGIAMTLINQKEQNKFHRIEQLIGEEIKKANTPNFLGKSPEYRPRTEKIRSKNRFSRKK
jgi:ATP-dependent RNA helicase RhlE